MNRRLFLSLSGGAVGAVFAPAKWASCTAAVDRFVFDAATASNGNRIVLDRGGGCIQIYNRVGARIAESPKHGMLMPRAMHVQGDEVLVCDTLNHRVQVFDLEGRVRRTIGSRLNGPSGLAVAANGDLHITSVGDACVYVFDSNGRATRDYGGYGPNPGQMLAPRSIAMTDGRAWITDAVSGHVHVFDPLGTFVARFPLSTGEYRHGS